MPTSMLFGVNNEGRVFGLSTNGTKWREFPFPGIEFKHLSSVPHYLWAIGSDRQIYLHVHGLDTAIRIKEEAYENQRWLPVEGFSNRLLPTDRYAFSSEDGLVERRKDKIRVPSMAWKWESDWKIETVLDNEPLDHDGWTYAVDFPATYCGTKKWTSCVRRRKWVRYRKYIAMNSWCSIAPLHSDPTQEPFRDVSVGGQNMTGGAPGAIQVWAVTIHGRVMWRKGVSTVCPEGTKWNEIPVPGGVEVRRIWAGPGDKVWAVTSTGNILVRTGISPAQPTGENWQEIEQPLGDVKLSQICVGTNAVWALGDDMSLWFRKGTLHNPLGTGWVHMVGYMASISISPNDQVVGVGSEDRNLYIRIGMDDGELAGKRWKLIETPVQDSRASSVSSLSHHTNQSMDDFMMNYLDFETSRSAPTSLNINPIWNRHSHPSSLPATQGFIEEPALCNHIKEETDTRRKLTAWSPVRSVGSVLGLEANADTNPLAVDVESEVFRERESVCEPDWKQVITIWSHVEAGALEVDPNHLPNWFSDSGYNSGMELSPWRCKILQNLQLSNQTCKTGYEKFELAVERTSSVKNGECRYSLSGNDSYEDCVIELEWVSNLNGSVESGSFIVLSIEKHLTKYQVSLAEVVWVGSCSAPGVPRLAVYTMTSQQYLILQFSSDTDLDEWNAQITSVVCSLNNVEGKPAASALWTTTNLGDVFVFDPITMQMEQFDEENNSFTRDLTYKHKALPWKNVLSNGFAPESQLTVILLIPESCDRFSVNLDCAQDNKTALHFNPRFEEKVIVRNSMDNGAWGEEERDGAFTLQTQTTVTISILCQKDGFKIWIDGNVFTHFEHRMKPELICYASVNGAVHIQKITYKSNKLICNGDAFWKQMGGHMAVVETCSSGVTWGISADNTPWLYTGGWGGTFLTGLEKSEAGVHPMKDMYCLHVYENQRWNPLTGFTPKGLPTDRPMWSDSTGLVKRSRESTRLLNMHWQWVSEWSIDFTTPGGVDGDGWQYATDFPASYHSRKTITDYVRRRRWSRKCKLTIMGPWQEIGNSKIISVSLQQSSAVDTICVWAVGIGGDALFRRSVSASNPMGENWEQVACDQPLDCISCGYGNQVWAVSRKGYALWRFGITTSNPVGINWEMIDNPKGTTLKKVSIAKWSVWALDAQGKVFVRHEVSPVFPEGSHWELVEFDEKFEDISAGSDEIWTVSSKGMLYQRVGVCKAFPVGLCWSPIINVNWKTVSCRGYSVKN